MLTTLYLIRHGQAENQIEADFERRLTEVGIQEALWAGNFLARQTEKISYMVASAAQRTLATASIIADRLHYPQQEIAQETSIYGADVMQLCDVIDKYCHHEHLAIIGHNPGLSLLAGYLTDQTLAFTPPCGIFKLAFPNPVDHCVAGVARLVSFQHPNS